MNKAIYSLIIILIPLFTLAQTNEDQNELKKRLEQEIRRPNILFTKLIQSEVNGQFGRLGEIQFGNVKGEDRFVARSIINTNKSFDTIKYDVEYAINKLSNSEKLEIERERDWVNYIEKDQIWTSWIVTDDISNAKIYLEVLHSPLDKKLHVTTYAFNFETSTKNMLKPGYYIGLFSGWKSGGQKRHSWLVDKLRKKFSQDRFTISCIEGLDKSHTSSEIERYREKNPRFLTTNVCDVSSEVFIGPFENKYSMKNFFEENQIENIDLHLYENFYKCEYTCEEL